MAQKDRKSAYEDELAEAKWMVEGVSDGGFELEEILEEYGHGAAGIADMQEEPAAQPVPEDEAPVPEETPPEPKKPPARRKKPKTGKTPESAEEPAPAPKKELEKPEPQREITMEDVVSRTIDEVMEERREFLAETKKRGLFSRRRLQDTEQFYDQGGEPEPEEEPEEEIGPEEPLREVGAAARRRLKGQRIRLPLAALLTILMIALMVVEDRGIILPYWSGSLPMVQAGVLGGVLAVTAALCWDVFARTIKTLLRRRITCELLASAAAIVTLLDCAAWVLFAERTPVMPYAAPVCAALTAALWGELCRTRAIFDTCRTASITETPPYMVTDIPDGACKQLGKIEGFYTDLMKDEEPVLWQTALVPVIFMGTLVFAGLASLGKGEDQNFLLCWSVILSAASSLSLPLVWALPWSGLARQLQKSNCAVAGWAGAVSISRKKAVILGDEDLFPPGTVKINGIKLYGEEMGRAVAYAASLVKESGSGLTRLFDGLLKGESGTYMKLDNFSFYEEGGYAADYRGESLLLGTASFMRKMDVRLPNNLNLRTGIFLSVDRQLVAVFAVKYQPAENVDWAMRMLRRNHITFVLAARDPNIAPSLLRRKFTKGVKVQYPQLATRLALSEQEDNRGRPRAVLLREGLLPYAEAVVGSRRLCRSARESTAFALLGSIAGTLLTGYLTSLGGFALMEPLTILVFQLLWVAPVLLLAGWAGRF